MFVTESKKTATATAIQRIAYVTAKQAKGQRQKDAIAHCKRIGIDHTAKTLQDAIAA